jgi:hypothetical protein
MAVSFLTALSYDYLGMFLSEMKRNERKGLACR